VAFEKAQRAITPGQVLAIYHDERLLASAIYSANEMGRALLST